MKPARHPTLANRTVVYPYHASDVRGLMKTAMNAYLILSIAEYALQKLKGSDTMKTNKQDKVQVQVVKMRFHFYQLPIY